VEDLHTFPPVVGGINIAVSSVPAIYVYSFSRIADDSVAEKQRVPDMPGDLWPAFALLSLFL
jgi:hypothetical protein